MSDNLPCAHAHNTNNAFPFDDRCRRRARNARERQSRRRSSAPTVGAARAVPRRVDRCCCRDPTARRATPLHNERRDRAAQRTGSKRPMAARVIDRTAASCATNDAPLDGVAAAAVALASAAITDARLSIESVRVMLGACVADLRMLCAQSRATSAIVSIDSEPALTHATSMRDSSASRRRWSMTSTCASLQRAALASSPPRCAFEPTHPMSVAKKQKQKSRTNQSSRRWTE